MGADDLYRFNQYFFDSSLISLTFNYEHFIGKIHFYHPWDRIFKKTPDSVQSSSVYASTISSYASASIRLSNCDPSDTSMTTIQAPSYGDSLTSSGLSSSSSFTSTTVPLKGASSSETVLTDSTLPNDSPLVISSPSAGSSTKTMSPSSDCANSVMPSLTLPSSCFTHS